MEPGKPLKKQKVKEKTQCKTVKLLSFNNPYNSKTARLFKLINYYSYHLIRKSLYGLQTGRNIESSFPKDWENLKTKLKHTSKRLLKMIMLN